MQTELTDVLRSLSLIVAFLLQFFRTTIHRREFGDESTFSERGALFGLL